MPQQAISLRLDTEHGTFRRVVGHGKILKVFFEASAVAADEQRRIGQGNHLSVLIPEDKVEQNIVNARSACRAAFDAYSVQKTHGQIDEIVFFSRDRAAADHRKLHPDIAGDQHQPVIRTAAVPVAGVAVTVIPALQGYVRGGDFKVGVIQFFKGHVHSPLFEKKV